MTQKIHNYSIRVKLVFLLILSSVFALFIATTSHFIYTYYDDKDRVVKNSIKLSKVSGKNIAASLMFLDKDSINMILTPILIDKDVRYIEVLEKNGHSFTSLGESQHDQENWSNKDFSDLKEVNVFIDLQYIDILTSITYADETIGFLKITTSTDGIKDRMIEQAIVSMFIVLITVFIMIGLAFWVEKIFSKPIFDLLKAMKSLEHSTKFDVKLEPYTQDEFRELFMAFNTMVNEISQRDKILKEHNLDLKSLVDNTHEELKTTQDDLQKASVLAKTDALTNLPNRRFIMNKFDEMIDNAKRSGKDLGVIMIDIDHFKKVNDNYGHQAGDIVIKEVANILYHHAREHDVVSRIGGEEFLVLCRESDTKTTFDIAERFRKTVEESVMTYQNEKTTQVTISAGIYSAVPYLRKEDLMHIADEALYNAKETGRNKVSIAKVKS